MIKIGKYIFTQHYLARFLLIFLLFLSSCDLISTRQNLSAIDGVLDLKDWSFQEDGIISLSGEWDFFWQELLSPDDFRSGDLTARGQTFKVPGVWNEYQVDGSDLPEDGYATFRLRIRHKGPDGIYAVRVPTISSAYQLWVNGERVAFSGKVGRSQEEMEPNWTTQIAQFYLDQPLIELVLQVSNFNVEKGGPWNEINFGTGEQIRNKRDIAVAYDLFLFGTILIIALYHFVIYLLRKQDRSPLFLSIFCLLIATRILLVGERFLLTLMPEVTWQVVYRLDFLTFYLAVPVFYMLIHSLFPQENSEKLLKLVKICGIAFSLSVVLTSTKLFVHTLIPYQILTTLVVFWILFAIGKAVKNKRGGSVWLLFSTTVLLGTVLNDIFLANQFYYSIELAPLGLYIFIFIHSAILSARFSRSFRLSEHLSRELEEKNRELSHLSQLKDEFLSRTSHELRTPLNGIVGLAQAMLSGFNGPLPAKATENLSLIENCGLRLTNLVNDILDFTELKYRELKLRREPVDIQQIADLVVKLLEPQTRFISLTLQNEIPQDLPFVNGDENRLRQILNNLIGNAIKFTPSGTITVSAREQGEFIEISVADTGIGIPQEKQKSIFNSFEQAGKSLIKEFGGTGLGLSITRQLVDLHGGEISVTSIPGEGSEFRFTIPIATAETTGDLPGNIEEKMAATEQIVCKAGSVAPVAKPVQQQRGAESSSGLYKGDQTLAELSILVVDDSPVNQQVLKANLQMSGARVSIASNGLECLEKLKGSMPDIVVMDVVMPKMNGFETAAIIRESYTREQLPIIFLSAKNKSGDIAKGFLAEGNDYLRKPFNWEELLLRIGLQAEIIRSRRRLQKSEQKYSKLFHRASEGILQISSSGTLLNINPSGALLFGFETPEVMRHRDIPFLDVFKNNEDYEQCNQSLKETGVAELEAEFVKEDGQMFLGGMLLHRVDDVEDPELFCEGIIFDISERRNREEAERTHSITEETNSAKSALLSNMNHELRTPIHSLLGYASLGFSNTGSDSSEKIKKYFGAIRQNGQKLLVLINDLLDLSRLEMGMVDYHFSQDRLSRLAQIAINEFEEKAEEKNIEVEFIPPEGPDFLNVDSDKMIRAISNLISNSIKFTEPGGAIKIGIRPNAKNLHFSISDNGVGIPNEELERVFEKFEHGSNNGNGSNGAGLGLAICQQTILGHNGKIWAENNPMGGTIVRFQVPKSNIIPHDEP